MVAEVAEMLHAFPEVEALDRAVARGNIHMLGTSGTVTTLAGVHLGLPRYDRRRVDGTWLTGSEVASLVTMLAGMDYDARIANPCIGHERADLVLAGCAILEAFRRRWPVDRLRVADRGLREGVLVELMAEDGVWRPRSARRDGHPQETEERRRRDREPTNETEERRRRDREPTNETEERRRRDREPTNEAEERRRRDREPGNRIEARGRDRDRGNA
jgi:exopolyphosphatase/pppGpp-phosphohydrolase